MRAALCDDQKAFHPIFQEAFASCLKHLKMDIELDFYTDPKQLYNSYPKADYALLFLDIDMPKMDGFELASMIRKRLIQCEIVFVSQRDELVYKSFSFRPLGFVRKSHIENELLSCLESFRKSTMSVDVEIVCQRQRFSIPMYEIMYIESKKNYIVLHMHSGKTYTIKDSLSEWEKRTENHYFVRIHAGYLVNCRAIVLQGTESVTLDDGVKLPVSRQKEHHLMSVLCHYLEDKSLI